MEWVRVSDGAVEWWIREDKDGQMGDVGVTRRPKESACYRVAWTHDGESLDPEGEYLTLAEATKHGEEVMREGKYFAARPPPSCAADLPGMRGPVEKPLTEPRCLSTCGTKHRGCDPQCPKRWYEEGERQGTALAVREMGKCLEDI